MLFGRGVDCNIGCGYVIAFATDIIDGVGEILFIQVRKKNCFVGLKKQKKGEYYSCDVWKIWLGWFEQRDHYQFWFLFFNAGYHNYATKKNRGVIVQPYGLQPICRQAS
mmetsp:Transcript_24766/g.47446  ORF Transcript_24766/g.47446 Transcript_24766/m.47446 type:complete len:109 (+) Transcript_24766:161-487(+)